MQVLDIKSASIIAGLRLWPARRPCPELSVHELLLTLALASTKVSRHMAAAS